MEEHLKTQWTASGLNHNLLQRGRATFLLTNKTNLVGGQEEGQREDQEVSWEELAVAPGEGAQSLVALAEVEVLAVPQLQQEGAYAEGP